jgi:hypothetical protein
MARGVYAEAGDHLFARRPPSSFLRLGFTAVGRDAIRPGIALLGQALRDAVQAGGIAAPARPAGRNQFVTTGPFNR